MRVSRVGWMLFTSIWLCGTSHARVDHFKAMAALGVEQGDAHARQNPIRALEEYARTFRYDTHYKSAQAAAYGMAQLLNKDKRTRRRCKVSRSEITRLLEYALLRAKRKPETLRDPKTPGARAKRLLRRLNPARAKRPKPLGPMGNELRRTAEKIVARCHLGLKPGAAGRFSRELGTVRAQWREPALAALDTLLAARDQLSEAQRLELFLAACSDWHRQERRRQQTPCDRLLEKWSALGRALGGQLDGLLTHVDPGVQEAAGILLGRLGNVGQAQQRVLLRQFFDAVDRGETDAALRLAKAFGTTDAKELQRAFLSRPRAWAREAAGKRNPHRERKKVRLALRALYGMRGGPTAVRQLARTADDSFMRRQAVFALLLEGRAKEASTVARIGKKADPALQLTIARAFREADDPGLIDVIEPILARGAPEATYRAIEALQRLSSSKAFRAAEKKRPRLARLAGSVLARRDLGKTARYAYGNAIDTLRRLYTPELFIALAKLRSDEPSLVQKQLRLAYLKSNVAPNKAIALARPHLKSTFPVIKLEAKKVIDRAEREAAR